MSDREPHATPKNLEWLIIVVAILSTVILTVGIRRLILVPIFHVSEMIWSTAFLVLALYGMVYKVLRILLVAMGLTPEDKRSPDRLARIFGVPAGNSEKAIDRRRPPK